MVAGENFPLINTEINGYDVIGSIGSGGFAKVYDVTRGGEAFAMKVCDPISGVDLALAKQMFQDEIRRQSSLSHVNVMPLLDSGTYTDETAMAFGKPSPREYAYFVMPRGRRSLHTMLDDMGTSYISPTTALRVVQDTANGLEYAHAQGVLHRDVKPSNIIDIDISGKPRWVLADFGVAATAHSIETSVITEQMFAGTRMYTAPEQLDLDARKPSDVYSLGIVASRMLVGKSVYDIDRDIPIGPAYRRALMSARRRPFSELTPHMNVVLEELEPVVARAVHTNLSERYQSPRAFADDFTNAYERGTYRQAKATVVIPLSGSASGRATAPTKPCEHPPTKPAPDQKDFHPGYAEPDDALDPANGPTVPARRKDRMRTPRVRRDKTPTVPRRQHGPETSRNVPPHTLRFLWVIAVTAASTLGLMYTKPGKELRESIVDDRSRLVREILQANPDDKLALTAALQAYVEEEVEQNRFKRYDDRPIRIMAGETSLVDEYAEDQRTGTANSSSTNITGSDNPALNGMYSSLLLSAYANEYARTETGKETALVRASYAQAYYWRREYGRAEELVKEIKAEERYEPPASENPAPMPSRCSDFTVAAALVNTNEDLARTVLDEACLAPGPYKGPFHAAGRLAAITGDMKNVQRVLKTLFEASCQKSSSLTDDAPDHYLFSSPQACTTNEQFASAADIAAYTLTWLRMKST